jgi:hypothetical protein
MSATLWLVFDQVEGVDAERDMAWARIAEAAKRFGVQISG